MSNSRLKAKILTAFLYGLGLLLAAIVLLFVYAWFFAEEPQSSKPIVQSDGTTAPLPETQETELPIRFWLFRLKSSVDDAGVATAEIQDQGGSPNCPTASVINALTVQAKATKGYAASLDKVFCLRAEPGDTTQTLVVEEGDINPIGGFVTERSSQFFATKVVTSYGQFIIAVASASGSNCKESGCSVGSAQLRINRLEEPVRFAGVRPALKAGETEFPSELPAELAIPALGPGVDESPSNSSPPQPLPEPIEPARNLPYQ